MPARRRHPSSRSSRALFRASQAEARLRALHAVALMRRDRQSLHASMVPVGTTPRTVVKYARRALRKRRGRYEAIPIDELRRPMRVLTERGIVVLNIRSSKTGSRLSRYWHAVDTYLRTGDRGLLAAFAGKHFRAEGQLVPFLTDPRLLDRLANAGQVSFEDLYEATV